MEDKLKRLRKLEAELIRRRRDITDAVQRDGRDKLTTAETKEFRKTETTLSVIGNEIVELIDELERSGRGDPVTARIQANTRIGDGNAGGDWASRATAALWKATEGRAITASSIDLPTLVEPFVIPMERPQRITDLRGPALLTSMPVTC